MNVVSVTLDINSIKTKEERSESGYSKAEPSSYPLLRK